MVVSEVKSLCILGRQPELGIAELEALYGAKHIMVIENAVLSDIPAENIDFTRLGGVIKVAKILTFIEDYRWPKIANYMQENIPHHLSHLPDGQFTLGFSAYGIKVNPVEINRTLLKIKKIIRVTERPVRVVPNKESHLNSAQVLHNKLTTRGAWELLAVKYGFRTILAQTLFVQDIEAYSARDQVRPNRDAKIGMLPPKLAQILLNLISPKLGATILDPFCGTGVLLQEALLTGFKVVGSDIDKRMIDYSLNNIEWLKSKRDFKGQLLDLKVGNATTNIWKDKIDAVVSEIYLGRTFTAQPNDSEIDRQQHEIDELLQKFLKNIGDQIKPNTRISLAVPAWRMKNGRFKQLSTLDNLLKLGYNPIVLKHVRPQELIYYRPGQFVARRLVIMEKQ